MHIPNRISFTMGKVYSNIYITIVLYQVSGMQTD